MVISVINYLMAARRGDDLGAVRVLGLHHRRELQRQQLQLTEQTPHAALR